MSRNIIKFIGLSFLITNFLFTDDSPKIFGTRDNPKRAKNLKVFRAIEDRASVTQLTLHSGTPGEVAQIITRLSTEMPRLRFLSLILFEDPLNMTRTIEDLANALATLKIEHLDLNFYATVRDEDLLRVIESLEELPNLFHLYMRFSEEAWSELRISTQTTIIDRLLAVPRPAFRRLAPNLFGTRNAGLRIGTRLFDHEALQELRTDILTADQEVTTRATVPEPQQATADGFFFPELALPRSRVILVLAVAALAWGIQQIPAINEAIGHWK